MVEPAPEMSTTRRAGVVGFVTRRAYRHAWVLTYQKEHRGRGRDAGTTAAATDAPGQRDLHDAAGRHGAVVHAVDPACVRGDRHRDGRRGVRASRLVPVPVRTERGIVPH